MKADVSVVIPTHDRVPLLTEALTSVSAQRCPPDEVLVVDDVGSTATEALVTGHPARERLRIRYLRNPTRGVCASRNLGAAQAAGRWLAFLDDDDLWRPDFLSSVLAFAEGEGSDFAMSGLIRHQAGEPPELRATRPGLNADTVFDVTNSMTGSNFVIRREVFRAVGGFDPDVRVFNDLDLFVRLLDGRFEYSVVSEPLAEWRAHPGERIASPTLRRADGIDFFLGRYRARLPRRTIRDLETMAAGIRRRHATTIADTVRHSFDLIVAHGVEGVWQRSVLRLRKMI